MHNNRFTKILYTIKHRKAFRQVEKQLYGKVSFRGYVHDLDKIFLYLIFGVNRASTIHRKYARHHIAKAKTDKDFVEMVIDWECARLTKSDKPLNAYDTLYKYYPELEYKVLPILQKLNIVYSTKIS